MRKATPTTRPNEINRCIIKVLRKFALALGFTLQMAFNAA